MAGKRAHPVWAWVMVNPCFCLFAALLLLLNLLPMCQHSEECKLWFIAATLFVLVSSVVTLGRSRVLFWVALLLASTAFMLLVASRVAEDGGFLAWSWRFSVGVFVLTLVHLVHYVLRPAGPEGMMIDRLSGG